MGSELLLDVMPDFFKSPTVTEFRWSPSSKAPSVKTSNISLQTAFPIHLRITIHTLSSRASLSCISGAATLITMASTLRNGTQLSQHSTKYRGPLTGSRSHLAAQKVTPRMRGRGRIGGTLPDPPGHRPATGRDTSFFWERKGVKEHLHHGEREARVGRRAEGSFPCDRPLG